jgi:Domain of unknown function (DUF4411)
VPFSLDTSGILDAWVRHYPPDVFPTIWSQMDVSARNGEIFVIEEVVRELEKKDDGIHKWVKQRETIVVPIDAEVQKHVVEIMSKYSRLVDSKKKQVSWRPLGNSTRASPRTDGCHWRKRDWKLGEAEDSRCL